MTSTDLTDLAEIDDTIRVYATFGKEGLPRLIATMTYAQWTDGGREGMAIQLEPGTRVPKPPVMTWGMPPASVLEMVAVTARQEAEIVRLHIRQRRMQRMLVRLKRRAKCRSSR